MRFTLGLVALFQIVTSHGERLGAVELCGPNWPIGSIIGRGPNEPNLRVVDRIAAHGSDHQSEVLVVEPVDKKRAGTSPKRAGQLPF